MVVPIKNDHVFGYPENVSVRIDTPGFFGNTASIHAPLKSLQRGTDNHKIPSVCIPEIGRSFIVILGEDSCIRNKAHFSAFKSFLLKNDQF